MNYCDRSLKGVQDAQGWKCYESSKLQIVNAIGRFELDPVLRGESSEIPLGFW
jgi:hypothetical protein